MSNEDKNVSIIKEMFAAVNDNKLEIVISHVAPGFVRYLPSAAEAGKVKLKEQF